MRKSELVTLKCSNKNLYSKESIQRGENTQMEMDAENWNTKVTIKITTKLHRILYVEPSRTVSGNRYATGRRNGWRPPNGRVL